MHPMPLLLTVQILKYVLHIVWVKVELVRSEHFLSKHPVVVVGELIQLEFMRVHNPAGIMYPNVI